MRQRANGLAISPATMSKLRFRPILLKNSAFTALYRR